MNPLLAGVFSLLSFFVSASSMSVVTQAREGIAQDDGKGLYLELLNSVFSGQDLKVSFETLPKARKLMKNGKFDMQLGEYSGRRLVYPKWAVDHQHMSAMYQFAKFTLWPGQGAFSRHKVGWVEGRDIHLQGRKIGIAFDNFWEVLSLEKGIEMLHQGKIEILMDDADAMWAEVRRQKLAPAQYRVQKVSFAPVKLYVVFPMTAVGQKTADRFDRRMWQLYESGELVDLYYAYDRVEQLANVVPSSSGN